MLKTGPKGALPSSHDLLFLFWNPLISLEWVKVQTSNSARGLKVRDRILNRNAKLVKMGSGLDHVPHLGPITCEINRLLKTLEMVKSKNP